MSEESKLLWQPSKVQVESSNVRCFMNKLNAQFDLKLRDYSSLYQFSIERSEEFWDNLWDFASIIGDKGHKILKNSDNMLEAKWFDGAKLNFAENLLSQSGIKPAISFWAEDKVKTALSYQDLKTEVASFASYLKSKEIEPGDVVAGFMPNIPQTVVCMLATASVGAVWTSCSPDFGEQGVLDRFGQVKPKLLIAANAYYYNGKTHSCLAKISTILKSLPSVKNTVTVAYANNAVSNDFLSDSYLDILDQHKNIPLEFTHMPFNAPLYIMYSSGTTGKPKCIVHGIGGTLLQHVKEHLLHVDLKPGDKIFYFTTCGWMMWNWLVSALASKATLMLYEGSPFCPDENILFDYVEQEKINVLGVSAKYLDVLRKNNKDFKSSHNLESLRTILSTGSVLVPDNYDYVYNKIKIDVCLSSISGGTDIVSCFALGSTILPVRRGQLQCKGLGMKIEVFDHGGKPVIGEKGELVCSAAFPSMPIYFWDDVDKKKYKNAYFTRYPNIWCHGDYVEETTTGGMIIYGRSDAVLNPGGVRIGTAEIYRQVEKLDEVTESIVIGQDWQEDVRVVLFVKLTNNLKLDEKLINKIKLQIRQNTTPRHVPAKVIQVNDIPRTKSGKIVEMAVRKVVQGQEIDNLESLANPKALQEFSNLKELTV